MLSARAIAAPDTQKDKARAEYIRANYTKFEHRIAMRDGKRLFTAVYLPNDRSKRYPILLKRTPYRAGPYGADRYMTALANSADYEKSGYIFVFQDVRGRFLSEGSFVNMRPHVADKGRDRTKIDESSDTYDTIAWLLANYRGAHNGRVGIKGISYPGFYASAGAIDHHPALKAISPQAPIADWFFDDMHRNGALVLPLTFYFFSFFGVPQSPQESNWPEQFDFGTIDGYQFYLDIGPLKNINARYFHNKIPFWNQIVAHPNYDSFWQARSILPHLRNIRAASLVVGGWYDNEDLYGPLSTYRAIEQNNPRSDNRLVIGPWSHGGWAREKGTHVGDTTFGFATSPGYLKRIEFPFFEHHLKGKPKPALSEATIFETGANRWRHLDSWPVKQRKMVRLYLRNDGALSFSPPTVTEAKSDRFISDPSKPVPYTLERTTRWARGHMGEDQRFAAYRPDVLVYATEPLKEDITVAGPLHIKLFVSTDKTAADWIVKLVDVQPGRLAGEGKKHINPLGGQQLLVRAAAIRGRFRAGFEKPQPFVPNKITYVGFDGLDVLHTFKRGHRIMIHLHSSWFPFFDRNPQTYLPNIFDAKQSDFVSATHRVYRSASYPTHIEFGQL